MKMKSQPSISIIIPTLNQGEFIETTIQSVFQQNDTNTEIIVIDGGSTDNTLQILKNYSGKLTWISEPDTGQSNAINKGFRIASAPVISWLNSDDILFPQSLNTVSNFFATHKNVDLVYGKCEYMDKDGNFIKPYPTQNFEYQSFVENAYNYIPQPATFFRRKLLSSIGFINESLHFIMDYEYWIRVGRANQITHIPQKLAGLRLHTAAKSVKDLLGFAEELEKVFIENIMALENDSVINKRKAMRNMYYRAAHSAYWSGSARKSLRFAFAAFKLDGYKPTRLLLQCFLTNLGFHLKYFKKNPYLL